MIPRDLRCARTSQAAIVQYFKNQRTLALSIAAGPYGVKDAPSAPLAIAGENGAPPRPGPPREGGGHQLRGRTRHGPDNRGRRAHRSARGRRRPAASVGQSDRGRSQARDRRLGEGARRRAGEKTTEAKPRGDAHGSGLPPDNTARPSRYHRLSGKISAVRP